VIRTLIGESNALVRAGLSAFLEREPDIKVVAELDRSQEVIPAACAFGAEVAVLDAGMAARDRFAPVRALHAAVPGCGALIMASASDKPRELREALTACADGVVLRESDPGEITEAVRRVAAGGKAVDPDIAFSALNSADNPLTPREVDVLRLVAEGAPVREIAAELCLSAGTVNNYLSRVIGTTGARNRVDAIRIADQAGWI
jgi:two-component system, NarL family, response regulator DesR